MICHNRTDDPAMFTTCSAALGYSVGCLCAAEVRAEEEVEDAAQTREVPVSRPCRVEVEGNDTDVISGRNGTIQSEGAA